MEGETCVQVYMKYCLYDGSVDLEETMYEALNSLPRPSHQVENAVMVAALAFFKVRKSDALLQLPSRSHSLLNLVHLNEMGLQDKRPKSK